MTKHGPLKRYQAHIFVFGTLFFNALNSALILIILIILGGQTKWLTQLQ